MSPLPTRYDAACPGGGAVRGRQVYGVVRARRRNPRRPRMGSLSVEASTVRYRYPLGEGLLPVAAHQVAVHRIIVPPEPSGPARP
ncbi:MAG TPA: hypothetical protein VMV92_17265 [Streptosporangiaceae bacterium]|nr:hypothetical protein [Streptosporangiaceae bacterium]